MMASSTHAVPFQPNTRTFDENACEESRNASRVAAPLNAISMDTPFRTGSVFGSWVQPLVPRFQVTTRWASGPCERQYCTSVLPSPLSLPELQKSTSLCGIVNVVWYMNVPPE